MSSTLCACWLQILTWLPGRLILYGAVLPGMCVPKTVAKLWQPRLVQWCYK